MGGAGGGVKGSAGLHSSLEALGQNPFLPFPASKGYPHALTNGPLPPSSKPARAALFLLTVVSLVLTSLAFLFRFPEPL